MVALVVGIALIVAGVVGLLLAVIESMSTTEAHTGLLGGGGLGFIFVGIVLAVWG